MEGEFDLRLTVRRDPPEESNDLYEGLCVHDDRVGAAVTIGTSRLPVWAIIGTLVSDEAWAEVMDGWPHISEQYGWDRTDMSNFLYFLMQPRGEFGRLLLVLADVERISATERIRWYETAELRTRVKEQLQRCLSALEKGEAESASASRNCATLSGSERSDNRRRSFAPYRTAPDPEP